MAQSTGKRSGKDWRELCAAASEESDAENYYLSSIRFSAHSMTATRSLCTAHQNQYQHNNQN